MESAAPRAVEPRPAATVLALRTAATGFEVLMVRRAREARFMGGARVFPGGSVDRADLTAADRDLVAWSGPSEETVWRAAALRELAEEAGLLLSVPSIDYRQGDDVYEVLAATGSRLALDSLEYLSNWVTPAGLPIRFDARFYVTEVPAGTTASSDEDEVYESVWVTPAAAIAAADAGRWQVEIPTRFHLELLADLKSVEEVISLAAEAEPFPIEPRLEESEDGSMAVIVPDIPRPAE